MVDGASLQANGKNRTAIPRTESENDMRMLQLVRLRAGLTLILCLTAAALGKGVSAQGPVSLDKYEVAATDSVEITVDERLLRMAATALSDKKPEERAVKELLAGLKGVYVRAFQFDREGVYQATEVEALRARFLAPEWSRVVGVRSRKYGENVDVFLSSSGSQLKGLAVVVASPRELVYVNISGDIDLVRLRELEGRFNVPKLDLYREGKE
jgi:hypothetical protein